MSDQQLSSANEKCALLSPTAGKAKPSACAFHTVKMHVFKGRPLVNNMNLTHHLLQKPWYFQAKMLKNLHLFSQSALRPQLFQKMLPETPKCSRNRPKMLPRQLQIGILGPPEWLCRAKVDQHDPNMAQDAPKIARHAPKLAQHAPTWPPRGISRPPGDPPGWVSAGIVEWITVEF